MFNFAHVAEMSAYSDLALWDRFPDSNLDLHNANNKCMDLFFIHKLYFCQFLFVILQNIPFTIKVQCWLKLIMLPRCQASFYVHYIHTACQPAFLVKITPKAMVSNFWIHIPEMSAKTREKELRYAFQRQTTVSRDDSEIEGSLFLLQTNERWWPANTCASWLLCRSTVVLI